MRHWRVPWEETPMTAANRSDRPIDDPRPRDGKRDNWVERIEKAREDHRLGQELRKGKPLTFPEQR